MSTNEMDKLMIPGWMTGHSHCSSKCMFFKIYGVWAGIQVDFHMGHINACFHFPYITVAFQKSFQVSTNYITVSNFSNTTFQQITKVYFKEEM